MTSVERVLAYTKFPVYVTHGLSIFICPFLKVIHNLDYLFYNRINFFFSYSRFFDVFDTGEARNPDFFSCLLFDLFKKSTASNPERDVLFVVNELYLVRAFDVINKPWNMMLVLPIKGKDYS